MNSLLLMHFLFSSFAQEKETYTTMAGYTFEQVESGWKDPDGNTWTKCIGIFSNAGLANDGELTASAATDACNELGASLPNLAEYKRLKVFFFYEDFERPGRRGLEDFKIIFRDQFNEEKGYPLIFWTSTAKSDRFARFVKGYDMYGDLALASNEHFVRCIVRGKSNP